jgi:SAM-dependent methyltransferase
VIDRIATSLQYRAQDLGDRLSGRADRLVPPRRLDFVGHSDFVRTGAEYLDLFTRLGGLQPTDRVLDVGSGIGRMARPLTGFLRDGGSYDGFDINAEGVAWCRTRYRPFPAFTFTLADLHNRRYNPAGTQPASSFRFPYEDASFDFVLLTSVLTHLVQDECDHYLAECARVLAPGGRLFATFFLLDEESRGLIAAGRSSLAFPAAADPMAVVDEAVPEEAVAYTTAWVEATLARHGLTATGRHPGSWCGRAEAVGYQDVITATRPEST